jgi:hypothetical protein
MSRGRAYTRHQSRRAKSKARGLCAKWGLKPRPRTVGYLASTHGKPCSGCMCFSGTDAPRKHCCTRRARADLDRLPRWPPLGVRRSPPERVAIQSGSRYVHPADASTTPSLKITPPAGVLGPSPRHGRIWRWPQQIPPAPSAPALPEGITDLAPCPRVPNRIRGLSFSGYRSMSGVTTCSRISSPSWYLTIISPVAAYPTTVVRR